MDINLLSNKESPAMYRNTTTADRECQVADPFDPDGGVAPQQPTVTAVTQAELRAFREAKEQAARCESLRKDLVARLAAGAWVEPGPLAAHVEFRPCKVLSKKSLLPAIGQQQVEELLALVEPTTYRRLLIDSDGDED